MYVVIGKPSYSHCQIISRLCKASHAPQAPSANQINKLYSAVVQEEPAWLFQSEDLYCLHLSQLPAPILSFAAMSCSKDSKQVHHNKTSSIFVIINHFVLEHNIFLSDVRNAPVAHTFVNNLSAYVNRPLCTEPRILLQ